MSDFQPEAFGKYFIVDKVAVGGMAEIFKAKTFGGGGFEKLHVIKRILGHLSDNEEFVRMFNHEANISATLQHANIVQIYEFGQIKDNSFIAMEYVDGKDLKALLRRSAERRRVLPVEFGVYIAHEVAKGLDYAHKKTTPQGQPLGIVHRDISPSNVLISYAGEIKVADFGIVRAEGSLRETRVGVLKGKFEYMSPEQASGTDTDARSDVFAVGIILHEMLTGRRLFKTKSEIQTLEKVKSADVVPPSKINPNVPARLDEIVMRALARDPDDRYPDARAMQTDLLDFTYPATPDLTRESLEHFMRELFDEEIADERARLERATRIALKMWERQQAGEEEAPAPGEVVPRVEQPTRWPVVIGAVGVLLIGMGLVLYSLREEAPPMAAAPAPTADSCPADWGCVILLVRPESGHFPEGVVPRVKMNGNSIGSGTSVMYNQVPPDQNVHFLVEADGYDAKDQEWNVSKGVVENIPIYLAKKSSSTQEKAPDPTPTRLATDPGTVRIESNPKGAKVYVNEVEVGETPFVWTDGIKNISYELTLKHSGYKDMTFELRYPQPGEGALVSKDLVSNAVEEGMGMLYVTCSPSVAKVLVDGVVKAATTPAQFTVPVGPHRVSVVSPANGKELDARTVPVTSGVEPKRISLNCPSQ